jgi:hypothetical protein
MRCTARCRRLGIRSIIDNLIQVVTRLAYHPISKCHRILLLPVTARLMVVMATLWHLPLLERVVEALLQLLFLVFNKFTRIGVVRFG